MKDPAELAFQPLVDLEDGPAANLTARAATHWLRQARHDAWGAFMLLVEPSRGLLRAGGLLDLPLIAADVQTSHAKWTSLLADTRSAEDTIFLARLLLYSCFVADAEAVLDRLGPRGEDLDLWAIHLASLCARMRNAASHRPALEQALARPRPPVSARLRFDGALSCAWVYLHERPDRAAAEAWIARARLALDESAASPWQAVLARARLARYEASYLERAAEPQARDQVLDVALAELREATPPDDDAAYLLDETGRRLLDTQLRLAVQDRDHARAAATAAEIVSLDPTCGRARWLAGDLARRTGLVAGAIEHFRAAATYGPIERPAALAALSELVSEPAHAAELAVQARSARATIGAPLAAPIHDSYVFPAGQAARQDLAAPQPESTVYRQMLPFWELRTSEEPAALLTHTPLLAWQAFQDRREPWYRTLVCQRAMVASFRRELSYASTSVLAWSERRPVVQLAELAGRSPQIDELLAACADREALPPVARAQLSRTVAALGFLRDSLELLPAPDPAERLSPEQAYVESTRYFTRSIQQLSAPGWTDDELAALYARIPAAKETLRIRLLFAIAGCVLTAQRTQTARALAWRAAASAHLNEVKACPEFSPFEQQLLESRYWRAVCYCPFLTGDRGALRTEAEACERLARDLPAGNAHEELLRRENLFPALETNARIFTMLGEPDRAAANYEEIVESVDPLDAKAWIQVGESREKRRDLAGARRAFLRAQALGAPLGYVAAYQAGRLSEQLGLHDEAILCQLRSLALWPSGLSPLLRLHALGRITGDAALVRFAEHGLVRVRDHGTIAPAERARIEKLIGAAA